MFDAWRESSRKSHFFLSLFTSSGESFSPGVCLTMAVKKRKLSFEEKLANAEKVLAGKKINPNGRKLFEKVIKKAAKPKQRGSK